MNSQIQMLLETRLMTTDQEIDLFEETIAKIGERKSINDIPSLCCGFDDNTQHVEVMYTLIHSLDYYYQLFESRMVVTAILNSVNVMYPHAKGWIKTILIRHLNHETIRQDLIEVFPNLSGDIKEILMRILKDLSDEDYSQFGKTVEKIENDI